MNVFETMGKLGDAFPGCYLTQHGEVIVDDKHNEYFILRDCETETDVKCKILEWLSRAAIKDYPFGTKMTNGINKFLGTSFDVDDLELIYRELGNRCNHELTIKFIESGYDMGVLKGGNKE